MFPSSTMLPELAVVGDKWVLDWQGTGTLINLHVLERYDEGWGKLKILRLEAWDVTRQH